MSLSLRMVGYTQTQGFNLDKSDKIINIPIRNIVYTRILFDNLFLMIYIIYMTINTTFSIKDRVLIKELEKKGRVTAMFIDSGGITYRVAFFDSSERREYYFQEQDLSLIKEENTEKLGFSK